MLGVADMEWGDDPDTIEAFVAQTGVTFPALMDTGTFALWDWAPGASPFPRQAVLDRHGAVTYMASEHDAEALEAAILAALEAGVGDGAGDAP